MGVRVREAVRHRPRGLRDTGSRLEGQRTLVPEGDPNERHRRGMMSKPTLDTVAAEAGVSRATVSRVINGSPRVSPEVKVAVETAIAALGYVPNRAARSLAMRRTDSIALVMREPDATVLNDPYLGNIIIATSQTLIGTGVQLVLVNAQNTEEHAQLADYVRSGHVDGVLLASMHDD